MIANDSNRLSQVQTPNCSHTQNLCFLSYISSIIKQAEMFRWTSTVNSQTANKRFLVRGATNPEKAKIRQRSVYEWCCRKIWKPMNLFSDRSSHFGVKSFNLMSKISFLNEPAINQKIFLYLSCQKLNNKREICASRLWFFVHLAKISHNYCTWHII